MKSSTRETDLLKENQELRARTREMEDAIRAIREGEVDAIVASTPRGDRVFTLTGAETPYRTIVENMGEGAATLTGKGLILYANARFSQLLGIPLERIIGASLFDFFPIQDRTQLKALLSEGRRETAAGELTLVTGKKTSIPVYLSLNKLLINEEPGLSMIITDLSEHKRAEDILRTAYDEMESRVRERTAELSRLTASLQAEIAVRKQTEQALRRSEAVLKQAGQMANVGAWELEIVDPGDPDANPLHWSDEVFRIFGYKPGGVNVTNRLFFERVHPDDRLRVREVFARAVAEKQPYSIEHRVIRPDGDECIVFEHAEIAFDDQGRPVRIIGAVQDITERKRAEARLRRFYESGMIGMIHWNMEGAITDANDKFLEMLGYTREDLVAGLVDWAQMTPPEYRELDEYAIHELKTTGVDTPYEKEYIRKDGIRIPIIIGAAMLDDARYDGVAFVLDITERKEIEEQLKRTLEDLARSNRELEQFAYVASHDLQEPLRMVASYVELLAERYRGKLDEKADQYINYAVDGVFRMQRLIEDLLAYSRIATRGSDFRLVDMNDMFAETIANLSSVIDKNRAVVTRDELPAVIGDKTQLMQLFQNLISNAVKFRKPDIAPRVHIAAKKGLREWIFSVRDNGIGIDEKYFSRIFQIFQRLHTREEYPGTGIGLALCKRIVERHEGRIWAESASGEGSTFFFTLPEKGGAK